MSRMPKTAQQPAPDDVESVIRRIADDRAFRKGLARESHAWFFMTYLRRHMTYALAPFHREIFELTQDPEPLTVLVAFRGSGKSTLVALSYVLWAALTGRKRHILVISKTETQAKQILYNIKTELAQNRRLAADFGPFNAGDVWNESSIVLPRHKVRITALSADGSLRGLKDREFRPDIIILDDVEDADSVRTFEQREKRYQWLKSEVIPAGSDDCNVFVLGNRLHEDSLVSRLEREIERGETDGIYRRYPILSDGIPTWPSKFPDAAAVDQVRRRVGDRATFEREYMQELTPEGTRVVKPEMIRRYHDLPTNTPGVRHWFTATGIDIAASLRDSADYMALVTAHVYEDARDGQENGFLVYVLPLLTNDHLTLQGLVNRAKFHEQMAGKRDHRFYLEHAGQQILCKEPLERAGLFVEAVGVEGMDKRARLMLAANYMEAGHVYFPHAGAEELITQITGYPGERRDDLMDAFTLLVRKAAEAASEDRGGPSAWTG